MPSRTLPKKSASILIVDDHPSVAAGFALCFKLRGYAVDEAVDAPGAIKCCRESVPDVLVVDLGLPGMDGVELMGKLRKEFPSVRVVLITGSECPAQVHRAASEMPDGFLHKRESITTLVTTVESALVGGSAVSQEIMALSKRAKNTAMVSKLSDAELAVLRMLAEGLSSKEIARRRNCSEGTVEKQRKSLFEKLGVRSAMSALRAGRESGLI
jgi:DNA-binding NarL/FixJ family response regulator